MRTEYVLYTYIDFCSKRFVKFIIYKLHVNRVLLRCTTARWRNSQNSMASTTSWRHCRCGGRTTLKKWLVNWRQLSACTCCQRTQAPICRRRFSRSRRSRPRQSSVSCASTSSAPSTSPRQTRTASLTRTLCSRSAISKRTIARSTLRTHSTLCSDGISYFYFSVLHCPPCFESISYDLNYDYLLQHVRV